MAILACFLSTSVLNPAFAQLLFAQIRVRKRRRSKRKKNMIKFCAAALESLDAPAVVKAVVMAENADRKFIYKAIVEQNNLGEDALATVEGVFAGVQRDKAASGDKVQDAAGNWSAK